MYKNLVARRACALAVTSFFFSFPFSAQAQTAPVAPPVKAAFVYVAPLTDAGWVRQHDQGRKAVEAALSGKVQTTFVENVAEGPDAASQTDLDEARKLINALAGLITAAAPDISDSHARPLRDGLRSLQLAFREASPIPDEIGKGPGEKWTGPVN